MALYFVAGSEIAELTLDELRPGLIRAFSDLGERNSVLIIPPDASRFHSRAGELTQFAYEVYGEKIRAVLPALGTHSPMQEAAIDRMFGSMPRELFRVHRWREDVVTLGEVPADFIFEQSEGRVNYPWPAQVNRLLIDGPSRGSDDRHGRFDLILSIGQVVPHEVVGMANYNKNILVGTGGVEGIDRSHYLGAVYGMERIMGRADTPVRRVLNYASDHFLCELPMLYLLTVIGRNQEGKLVLRGVFMGDDSECFERASALSLKVNFEVLDREIHKAIVYLDPHEFHSTWLGNKAIYRTRMALADDAELIVLAPGVREFGEDAGIDRLIRKYGYRSTPETLRAVDANSDLAANLSAAAHLIHGSSEGRFHITYCPGGVSKSEVESVNYKYGELSRITEHYDPRILKDGWNIVAGEEVFFVSNPGLGLWASAGRSPTQAQT